MTINAGLRFHEGLNAVHSGDLGRAKSIADEMFSADPHDVHALQIMGFLHYQCGRNHEALEAYIRANRVVPNQPAILGWIGDLFKERGDFDQAHKAYAQTLEIAPGNAEMWGNLAQTLALKGDRASAKTHYEKAVEMEPSNSVVLAKAARFFEDTHDLETARRLAEQALALEPENEIAQIAIAEVDIRERKYSAVTERLGPILKAQEPNPRNGSKMFHQLATAYHQTGQYDEAHSAYKRANNLQHNLYAEFVAREQSPLSPQRLDQLIEFFSHETSGEWTNFSDLSGPTPVFLVGFIRSGTTWLDQILSSHKDFVVMEEEDNFFDAWRKFLLSPDGLAKLKSMSAKEVDYYRGLYWRKANQHLPQGHSAKFVVDKVPLNTVQLGLIHRLFPDAKIIFAIRDPRDSVWSAFQQHFAMNTSMYQFLSLDTAAAYYDKVMTLGRIFRERMPLKVHEVYYERLVEDLEAELKPLFEFLEADWSDTVLNYFETARERSIMTASAKQVIQKPYKTSRGKWRNYEKQMAPVLPILNKWAEHFGYPTD